MGLKILVSRCQNRYIDSILYLPHIRILTGREAEGFDGILFGKTSTVYCYMSFNCNAIIYLEVGMYCVQLLMCLMMKM